MRVRTLMVVGAVVAVVGAVIGSLLDAVLDDGRGVSSVAVVAAGLSVVSMVAIIGLLAGWFGRERDDVVLVAIAVGVAAGIVVAGTALVTHDVSIGVVILAGMVAVAGAVAGTTTWWIGSFICEMRGLPTAARLVAPAYADDQDDVALWTTEAGPELRATLDRLAARAVPGRPVEARAVGIVLGLPRDVPVVVLLAGDRLVIGPVDLAGAATGAAMVFTGDEIAGMSKVSMRPGNVDGSERRHINPYGDVISIRWPDGRHVQLRLPYGTRGAGTSTGGPEEIRAWLLARSGSGR